MRTRIAIVSFLGAIALAPGLAIADEHASLEQVVVETAKTPAEHQALANHYRAEAADAKAEAAEHERMANTYKPSQEIKMSWGTVQQRQKMADHCKRISQQSAANAQDFEALAKLHDEEAKKTQ